MKFANDVLPILHLMEKNINRIEFVKDHLGIRDFVFLAEREAQFIEYPYFACFDLDIIEDDEAHNFVSMNKSIIYDLKEIYKNAEHFFENSEAILYVEIGFKESIPTEEDRFRAYELLKSKEVTDIQEAKLKLRKFPLWYDAKFSKDVQNWINLYAQLEKIDVKLLSRIKQDVRKGLDLALLENDEEKFIILSTRYKKIRSEMF